MSHLDLPGLSETDDQYKNTNDSHFGWSLGRLTPPPNNTKHHDLNLPSSSNITKSSKTSPFRRLAVVALAVGGFLGFLTMFFMMANNQSVTLFSPPPSFPTHNNNISPPKFHNPFPMTNIDTYRDRQPSNDDSVRNDSAPITSPSHHVQIKTPKLKAIPRAVWTQPTLVDDTGSLLTPPMGRKTTKITRPSPPLPKPPMLKVPQITSYPLEYDGVEKQQVVEKERYDRYEAAPTLVPPFNPFLLQQLKTTPIIPFTNIDPIFLKAKQLQMVPRPDVDGVETVGIMQSQGGVITTPSDETTTEKSKLQNNNDQNIININDTESNNVIKTQTTEKESESDEDEVKMTSEVYGRDTHRWLKWSDYLLQMHSNSSQIYSTYSAHRRSYQSKFYHAEYANSIRLDTNPPTIEFDILALSSKSSKYNTITPISSPSPRSFFDPINQILSKNPFSTYLGYNRTQNTQRRDAIAKEIAHTYTGYAMFGFGSDEFHPVTQSSSVQWGIGLSILDSIGTLMLAGNEEHIADALNFIETKLIFSQELSISIFEVTIRGLGGLLSAYSLRPEHTLLLERAVELGELLYKGFIIDELHNNFIKFGLKKPSITHKVGTAEILTLQLEFETLSKYTGDLKYAMAVRSMMKIAMSTRSPLLGTHILIDGNKNFFSSDNSYGVGAMIDSSYEYFIKLWVLHNKPPYKLPVKRPRVDSDDKNDVIDDRKSFIWRGIEYSVHDQDILWAKFEGLYDPLTGLYIPLHLYYQFILHFPSLLVRTEFNGLLFAADLNAMEVSSTWQHLACFVGGMLAFGQGHGAHDDYDTIVELYQVECVHMPTAVPCEFVRSVKQNQQDQQNHQKSQQNQQQNQNQQNQQNNDPNSNFPPSQYYYSTPVLNYDPAQDNISIVDYMKTMLDSWSNELTHTCIMGYSFSKTQLGADIQTMKIDYDIQGFYKTMTFNKTSHLLTMNRLPSKASLYRFYREMNQLDSEQQYPVIIPNDVSYLDEDLDKFKPRQRPVPTVINTRALNNTTQSFNNTTIDNGEPLTDVKVNNSMKPTRILGEEEGSEDDHVEEKEKKIIQQDGMEGVQNAIQNYQKQNGIQNYQRQNEMKIDTQILSEEPPPSLSTTSTGEFPTPFSESQSPLQMHPQRIAEKLLWLPPEVHWADTKRCFQRTIENAFRWKDEGMEPCQVPPVVEIVGERNTLGERVEEAYKTKGVKVDKADNINDITKRHQLNDFYPPRSAQFLLRPETVESVFYLYQTTGHEYYRETMWAIFLQIVYYCRIYSGGYSTLSNVEMTGFSGDDFFYRNMGKGFGKNDQEKNDIDEFRRGWEGWKSYHNIDISSSDLIKLIPPSFNKDKLAYGFGPQSPVNQWYWANKLESWFIAETLKYIYLTFALEPHAVASRIAKNDKNENKNDKNENSSSKNLQNDDTNNTTDSIHDTVYPYQFDQWVFSTEAHPLPM